MSTQNKFYVMSGDVHIVLLAESPQKAAQKAYTKAGKYANVESFFYVDERGWRHESTHKFRSEEISKLCGFDEGGGVDLLD